VLTDSRNKQIIEIFNSIDFNKIIDHPNILIAANFWDEERYCAARTCYKFMRTIDDLIDNYKAENKLIPKEERIGFVADVRDWLSMIIVSGDCNPGRTELIRTIEKFRIPLWPLEAFAKSMIYDINNDGFPTLNVFIEYSRGASVAPASVFVHLSGLTHQDGTYVEPSFDVKEAAIPCAMFSYIVHIIRDFQKDQLNHLNYFADETIRGNNLTTDHLKLIAEGASIPAGFRNMIRTYYNLAAVYKEKTLAIIDQICPSLEPRYRLSLMIIFSLYTMVYERIDVENGKFTGAELNPTPEEIKERVYQTIVDFRE